MSDAVVISIIGGAVTLIPLGAKGLWTVARSMADDEARRAKSYREETEKTLAAKNIELDTKNLEITTLKADVKTCEADNADLRQLIYGQGDQGRRRV